MRICNCVEGSVKEFMILLIRQIEAARLKHFNKYNIMIKIGFVCIHRAGECQATDKYIAEFEDMLRHSCGQKVAGFIAEYIQVR